MPRIFKNWDYNRALDSFTCLNKESRVDFIFLKICWQNYIFEYYCSKSTKLLDCLFSSQKPSKYPYYLSFRIPGGSVFTALRRCTADGELNKDSKSCSLLGWMTDIWPQCLCVTSWVTCFRLDLLAVDRIALHTLSFPRRMLLWNCVVIHITLDI